MRLELINRRLAKVDFMSRIVRLIWLMTLLIFASGCAGYRPATISGTESPEEPRDSENQVEIGSEVKVTKTTGVVVTGEVVQFNDDHLILEISGVNGQEEYRVAYDEIESIKVKKGSNTVVYVLIGAAIVVVSVVLAGAIFDTSREAAVETLN